MALVPIIAHFEPRGTRADRAQAADLAETLRREHPALVVRPAFDALRTRQLVDAPTLHLDDLSGISRLERQYDVRFLQTRARMRAGDGDFVASCFRPAAEYEPYFRDRLGLGAPSWLFPKPRPDALRVATACWQDRSVRRILVHAMRSGGLAQVHPHMGILEVWELAALLHDASRRPVSVVAPPPGLTAWVNDKVRFAQTVRRLLGPSFVPSTSPVGNVAVLAAQVRDLSRVFRSIALKMPDSAGGSGTIVIDAHPLRHASLAEIGRALREAVGDLGWEGRGPLQVGGWETEVLSSPSAQLWIPPLGSGDPIVEALFEQFLSGPERCFSGSRPAELPPPVAGALVNMSWRLALLFQHWGYVGRCSFDALILGPDLERCRVEFTECNGRWGGTSGPMTMVSRIFGDFSARPYLARECVVPGLERFRFADLLAHLEDDLFDAGTGRGRVILYNSGRLQAHAAINVLGLGRTRQEAERLVEDEVPRRLRQMVAARMPGA